MAASKFHLSQCALAATIAVTLGFTASNAIALDKLQSKTQDQTRDQDRLRDPIYGSELMTEAERIEFRNRMRSLKSAEEREAYRLEHHKLMQERARERGLTLPATPPTLGKGMGPGPAAGGMGSGPGAGAAGGGMGAGSPGKK